MKTKTFLAAFALVLLAALPLRAGEICRATVNATQITIDRAQLAARSDAPGRAERMLGWPRLGVSRITNRPPACDSATLIAFLSRDVPPADLDGYCLLPDDTLGFLLVPGERNFRGRCATTTCDRVKTAVSGARAVAGTAADIATGRDRAAGQTRTSAVLHASGAAILSGSAAQILAGVGAGIGSATTAALAAPALAGAAAVSVVAVGGAVYLCR